MNKNLHKPQTNFRFVVDFNSKKSYNIWQMKLSKRNRLYVCVVLNKMLCITDDSSNIIHCRTCKTDINV